MHGARGGRALLERTWKPKLHEAVERPLGVFSRWLILGDTLDTENIPAGCEAGVLTLRIPVSEKAEPRKTSIAADDQDVKQINA